MTVRTCTARAVPAPACPAWCVSGVPLLPLRTQTAACAREWSTLTAPKPHFACPQPLRTQHHAGHLREMHQRRRAQPRTCGGSRRADQRFHPQGRGQGRRHAQGEPAAFTQGEPSATQPGRPPAQSGPTCSTRRSCRPEQTLGVVLHRAGLSWHRACSLLAARLSWALDCVPVCRPSSAVAGNRGRCAPSLWSLRDLWGQQLLVRAHTLPAARRARLCRLLLTACMRPGSHPACCAVPDVQRRSRRPQQGHRGQRGAAYHPEGRLSRALTALGVAVLMTLRAR